MARSHPELIHESVHELFDTQVRWRFPVTYVRAKLSNMRIFLDVVPFKRIRDSRHP